MSKKGVTSLIIVGILVIAGVITALTLIKQTPSAAPNTGTASSSEERDPLLDIFNNVSPNQLKSDFLSDVGPQKYTGPVPAEVVGCVNTIESAKNLTDQASQAARTLADATAACKATNPTADCECEDVLSYNCYGLNNATPPVYVENSADPGYQCADYTYGITNPTDNSVTTIGTLKTLKKQACVANEKAKVAIKSIPLPDYRYGVKHSPGTVLATWDSVKALAYSQNPVNNRETIKADLTPVFGYAVSRNQINWAWNGKTKEYTFKTAPGDEVFWACYFNKGSNFFSTIFRAKLVSLQLADITGLKGEFLEFSDPVERVVSGPTAKVSWDKVANATHYIVYVGTNAGGLEPMKDANRDPKLIAENTVTLKALPRDTTYFVIVQAVQDSNGRYGTQSEEGEAMPTYSPSSDFIQTLNIYYTDDVKTRFIRVSKRSDECGNKEVFSTEECDDGKNCSDGRACTTDAQCATVTTGDQLCTTRSGDGCTKDCKLEKKLCAGMTLTDNVTNNAACTTSFEYDKCVLASDPNTNDTNVDAGVTYGNTCNTVLNPAAGEQKQICYATIRANKQANYVELINSKICDNNCFEGECRPRAATFDKDGDGKLSNADDDIDGDNILNADDPDMDGDGVPNTLDPYPTL